MLRAGHYYKNKMVKMGKWALLPNDSETWHSEVTNIECQKFFGIPKGILALHTLTDGYQHMYAPADYFPKLYKAFDNFEKKGSTEFERRLKSFYRLVESAKRRVDKTPIKNLSRLSDQELVLWYLRIRKEVQILSVFDQVAWLGEEYWSPKMRNILEKRIGLLYGSAEYHRVLFILSKPEKISSTLKEKRDVIRGAIQIKDKKKSLAAASLSLAKKWGWMPVFLHADPWTSKHYELELKGLIKKDKTSLKTQLKNLANYTKIRNREISVVMKKYGLKKSDVQTFIDFGLALDARNEAEYFVSYSGFYLTPVMKEIAKRFALSLKQLRLFSSQEIVDAMSGKLDTVDFLKKLGPVHGWGFDSKMKTRIQFSPKEAEKLFKHIEKKVQYLQETDEGVGICASPGKASGRIRIVKSPSENYKVKDSDILVTYATTVDYLPAMKKAAAVVTEVGGLTCHAAVVSREFGIPCVVSLKNSMTKFKDGDLVEVDADKGKVTKLKT